MARRSNHYDDITPIEGHWVPRSEDTKNSTQKLDLAGVMKEVPFLITASEMQKRRNQRRKKHNAKRP